MVAWLLCFNFHPEWILDLLSPIALIMQEISIVKSIESCLQEQAQNFAVPHVAEATVGGVYPSADNAKAEVFDLLAQQIIFRVQGAFIEPAQLFKACAIEEHEHARTEGHHQHGRVLHYVISYIEQVVTQRAIAAPDVGGHAVQPALFGKFHSSTQQRGVFQFHVRVNEQDIGRLRSARACVSSNGRKAARDYLNVQTVRK